MIATVRPHSRLENRIHELCSVLTSDILDDRELDTCTGDLKEPIRVYLRQGQPGQERRKVA